MSPIQTGYETYHEPAVPGQIVDLTLSNTTSYVVEGSDIAMGLAVVKGTADDQCILAAPSKVFLGITRYTSAGTYNEAGLHLYGEEREANVVDFGKIWVTAEVTVARDQPVYYRAVATGVEVLGALSNVLDTDNVLIPGAYWVTGATAGDLAQVYINVIKNLS